MEEQRKGHTKWIVLASLILILVFCAFFFRVKTVSIEGNTYYTKDEMVGMFQTNIFEKNILSFWVMDHISLTPDLAFVREYEVTYPNLNEIHIKLYEKSIMAGIAYSNQYIYFDMDGMVLQSTTEALEDIPLFETKNLTTFTLYETVQMEDEDLLAQIMNLAGLFTHYEVSYDKVTFDEDNEACLYSGDITVLLGKKDNYDEEISALSSVLKKMSENNQTGQIDLRNYTVGGDIILKQSNTSKNSGE